MNQPIILNIKLTKPGVELVLAGLSKMPYEQVGGLIPEIEGQANYQLQQIRQAAETANKPTGTNPSTDAENAPSAPADPIPATAKQGE